MKAYLNRIDGIDDAIITMFLSKRNMTREKELKIRRDVMLATRTDLSVFQDENGTTDIHNPEHMKPIGSIHTMTDAVRDYLERLLKWGTQHITLLRFMDLSVSIYGMHRGGQDDTDAHSYRMNNRVIRASTRLGNFETGEMSEFYQGKIIPTDVALAHLGIETPDELEYEGQTYVRGTNGYILKGHENDKDYKRGLYMLSIPSDFVFRINLTEYSHVYKMRNEHGTANPEVKTAIESLTDQLEAATMGFVNRDLLNAIPN